MAQGETDPARNVLRKLTQIQALTLFVVWDGGEMTYSEIADALGKEGYRKSPGYVRRVVNKLNELHFFDRSTKPGKKKENLAFSIRRDGFNSRPLTSRILLELARREHEAHEPLDRAEFVEAILRLNLRVKHKTHAVNEEDIEKALKFSEENNYIERRNGSIRTASRTRQELPFMELIAVGSERRKRRGSKRGAPLKKSTQKRRKRKPPKRRNR